MNSLAVLPATPADIPILLDIYFTSFTNPLALVAFPPSSTSVQSWWAAMLNDEIQDPNSLFLKVVDPSLPEDGQIVAWAKWNRPHGKGIDMTLPEWPQDGDSELATRFFTGLAKEHERVMGSRGHYYLEILATSPVHQKRGAGSILMDAGVRSADEEGVEAYLEASPVSVGLYQKYGFEEVGKVEVDIKGHGQYANLCMRRKALEKRE
ncbi:acetyltransferas-like protein [Pseudovirgaria hyperparasitica]|uniref:Acetyltransferas-like protein n=1 Tax=Pseudovirgaria hyperparasitica TaxID=470096 RepID=A0A6A6WMH8_9PEZI|nr:acetyltransferas-like protein [Pseudovirgaria hyperparasitica]KAF2763427.1 acetyltransferas-like protein [Pseudovirgaria hyperparasitica]